MHASIEAVRPDGDDGGTGLVLHADLLGIDSRRGSALPPDGVSGLFAKNGETTG